MLKEVYYLIISKKNDRRELKFETNPSNEQILEAIKSQKGISVWVERRHELVGVS